MVWYSLRQNVYTESFHCKLVPEECCDTYHEWPTTTTATRATNPHKPTTAAAPAPTANGAATATTSSGTATHSGVPVLTKRAQSGCQKTQWTVKSGEEIRRMHLEWFNLSVLCTALQSQYNLHRTVWNGLECPRCRRV